MEARLYRPYLPKLERLRLLAKVAEGGYVIFPDGKVAAVADCSHYVIINRYWRDGEDALHQGAIRVSYCGAPYRTYVDWDSHHATPAALRSLRRILARHPDRIEFMLIDYAKVMDLKRGDPVSGCWICTWAGRRRKRCRLRSPVS